jgi:hypothetical protein
MIQRWRITLLVLITLISSETFSNPTYMPMMGMLAVPRVAMTTINLTIASNTQNYNIFTAAGSPAGAVIVNLTINTGVTVGSSSTATAALETGTFASGSVVNIINNGNIYGAGGAGGAGGNGGASVENFGSNGLAGGSAISLHYPVSITNNGSIWAGGGGGGGGGS